MMQRESRHRIRTHASPSTMLALTPILYRSIILLPNLTFAPETNKYALDPNDKAAMDEALAAANDTAISE